MSDRNMWEVDSDDLDTYAIRERVSHTSGSPEEDWLEPEHRTAETTSELGAQQPATIFYLGKVIDIPQVVEVYVERQDNSSVKHWTVIEDRDYDIMDILYEIERETIKRFPNVTVRFRVTVITEEGPSIANEATKIYDNRN